jgi:isocitrate dehydrogenase kinase/phosphatase
MIEEQENPSFRTRINNFLAERGIQTLERQKELLLQITSLVVAVLPTTKSFDGAASLFKSTICRILTNKDYDRLFTKIVYTKKTPNPFISDIQRTDELSLRLTGTILTCIHLFYGYDSLIARYSRSRDVQIWIRTFAETFDSLGKNQLIDQVPKVLVLFANKLSEYCKSKINSQIDS